MTNLCVCVWCAKEVCRNELHELQFFLTSTFWSLTSGLDGDRLERNLSELHYLKLNVAFVMKSHAVVVCRKTHGIASEKVNQER